MKFLFLLRDKYPQFRPDLAILFGREMAGRGHEIHWRMQSGQPLDSTLRTKWGGGPVVVAPRTGRLRWYHRVWNNVRDLLNDAAGLLRPGGYDVVQVKDKFALGTLGLLAARMNRGRYVYWLSYPFPEAWLLDAREGSAPYPLIYTLRGRLCAWLLYKVIMPSADHVMVQSEQMLRDVAARGIAPEKMTAVPMGVDLADFPPPVPSSKSGEVVYVGTMVRVRGLEFVLHAFRMVLEEEPRARLTMIGAGEFPEDLECLRREAERLGLAERVEFTGFMERARAMERVAAAAVCLSPFKPSPVLDSTSPTKLSEYLAMGKPVVANDHPEQSLVLGESGGGLVTPWDERAFAEAIVTLLRLTPAERDAMGARGRAWVEQHRTYAVIADMVERTYERVVAGERVAAG